MLTWQVSNSLDLLTSGNFWLSHLTWFIGDNVHMTRRVKIKRRPWHKCHFSLVKKYQLNRVKLRHFLRNFLVVNSF